MCEMRWKVGRQTTPPTVQLSKPVALACHFWLKPVHSTANTRYLKLFSLLNLQILVIINECYLDTGMNKKPLTLSQQTRSKLQYVVGATGLPRGGLTLPAHSAPNSPDETTLSFTYTNSYYTKSPLCRPRSFYSHYTRHVRPLNVLGNLTDGLRKSVLFPTLLLWARSPRDW